MVCFIYKSIPESVVRNFGNIYKDLYCSVALIGKNGQGVLLTGECSRYLWSFAITMTNLWEKTQLVLGMTLSCPRNLHLSSWRPTACPLGFQSPLNCRKPARNEPGRFLQARNFAWLLSSPGPVERNRRAWKAWEWRGEGPG